MSRLQPGNLPQMRSPGWKKSPGVEENDHVAVIQIMYTISGIQYPDLKPARKQENNQNMSRAAEHAYRTIRESILSGEFAPNSRLKEAELVAQCGYSRTPVREALRRLAAEDFILLNRNQGAQVKAWTAADIDDLFQLRALLEGYAAARAATHITLIQLDKIEESISQMDAVLSSDAPMEKQVEEFLVYNNVVHTTVWQAAGSERLESMLSRLIDQALVIRTARRFSLERIAQSHHHHEELLNSLRAHDALWSESIMRSHIHAARDALLVRDED